MKPVNETVKKVYGNYPEKVLQFGEGNFLRAFVDWMIDKANRDGVYQGSIVLCQPIEKGLKDMINAQDGVYTLAMRGSENGKAVENIEVITSVSRCINPYEDQDYDALMDLAKSPDLEVVVSNTTEAGIAYHAGDKLTDRPPVSFPAKVTAFLYERYKAFDGAADKGLLFLPVELIDNNGAELKRIVLQYADEWGLGGGFINWVENANEFTSTLVDRIVTGYPRDEVNYFEEKLGYQDNIIDTSELFNLWVIEGDKKWADKLPVHRTDANVIWTDDVKPYKKRKVRILNGAHTSTVLAAYLAGFDIVMDFMKDDTFRTFMNDVIYKEVIPTLDLPKDELESFAAAVNDRFANPYIKHKLLDISLNSCSKFNARCLPSLLGYVEEKKELPKCLTFSLAAFIKFYQGETKDGAYTGTRKDGTTYPIRDDAAVLEFFSDIWSRLDADGIAQAVLSKTDFWSGKDLTEVPGLKDAVAGYLKEMETEDVRTIVERLIG
ncbi:altronate oxidoreductase [Lachnoclostridium sp. An169]|uniref:tagaturonate reductase n=1 Tax=Lachnoclostridium sp. An169 TaxID=1965569 RepID=UPI000B368BCD|nr:tagaturonate reductase [Lachnoclostridium sp. An169]OUP83467.1 altronate oxidoreductase [Lachnoclostridium sp. An169]